MAVYVISLVAVLLTSSVMHIHGQNVSHSEICPEKCKCSTDFKTMDCSQGGIQSIPELTSSVRILILDNNPLGSLPPGIFKNGSNVRELSLRNCSLHNIEKESLDGLDTLSSLILTRNKLTHLPHDLFSLCNKISYLFLSYNKIKLPALAPAVSALSSLLSLDISHNAIKTERELPHEFASLQGLHTLKMNSAKIDMSSSFFSPLVNASLEYLSLASCHLVNVSQFALSDLPSLTKLDISFSNITATDASNLLQGLENATQLESLVMNGLFLWKQPDSTIHKHFFKPLINVHLKELVFQKNTGAFHGTLQHKMFKPLRFLERLQLDNCAIHTINDSFHGLKNLIYLTLSNNLLTCFDATTCGFLKRSKNEHHHSTMANLLTLDLSWNNIQQVTTDLVFRGAVFSGLKTLNLSNNKLTDIDVGLFHGLNRLENLDLSGNPIYSIGPRSFSGIDNLTNLYLNATCRLTVIGAEVFQGVRRLNSLYLEDNNIERIHPHAFRGLKRLQYLHLRDNFLGYANDSLAGVVVESELLRVDIGKNELTVIPEFVAVSPSITHLFLDHNSLMDDSLANLAGNTVVKVLDLSYNSITHLKEDFFKQHRELSKTSFAMNPFYCDCDFENIDHITNQSNISIISRDKHVCQGPPSAKGEVIFTFHASHWQCSVKSGIVPFICILCTLFVIAALVILKRSGCVRPRFELSKECCNLQNCYSPLGQTTDNSEDSRL